MTKRSLAVLVATVSLTLGAAVAHADQRGDQGQTQSGAPSAVAPVLGTVVSVDQADGTFVADAYTLPTGDGSSGDGGANLGQLQSLLGQLPEQLNGLLSGLLGNLGLPLGLARRDGEQGATQPTATQVTITTDPSTKVLVDGQPAGVADLAAGDKFVALFAGSPTDSLQTLVAGPAIAVLAHPAAPTQTQHRTYAFVGSVSAVDPTAGTVTVNVSNSLPSELVPAGSAPAPFTVGSETLVLGGSGDGLSGGLNDVSVGDIIAGGLVAPEGDTLAQIEALPLKVLLDIPLPAQGSSKAAARARRKALREALALLEGRSPESLKSHHRSHRSAARHKSGRHGHK